MPSQVQQNSSLPPAPYRAAPWYDPDVAAPRPLAKLRLLRFRWAMVFVGGVVLPIASLILNEVFDVVRLGTGGVAVIVATILSMGLNLVLVPTKRAGKAQPIVVTAPDSLPLRLGLLGSALFSALFWGYLAILFLPMLPLSAIGIIVMGVGFCGFCPYGALAISGRQSVRLWRLVRPQVKTWQLRSFAAAVLAGPIVLALSLGLLGYRQRSVMQYQVAAISKTAPFSVERMTTIAALRGQEEALIALYLSSDKPEQKRAISEVYRRLTDRSIRDLASQRWRAGFRRPIRPWWFLDGGSGVALNTWRI